MTCAELKPLLHARLDEELDPAQRVALDSHLTMCASCAADLEELKRMRHAVRGEMPYYKAPSDLRNRVRVALRGAEYLDNGARTNVWKYGGALAAGVAICALAAAPFVVDAHNQRQLVAEEFLAAHQRALIGRSMDVVSSDQHTVKPWFNGKLPFSPPVVDLRSEGFPLEGGRVDYAGDRPVAVLVYSRRLHRIDVFVRPLPGQKAPPAHFSRNGYNEISWGRDDFLFSAVSDLNDAELNTFVKLLQTPGS